MWTQQTPCILWATTQLTYITYVTFFKPPPASSELLYQQDRTMEGGAWLALAAMVVFGLEAVFRIWHYVGLLRDPFARVVIRSIYSLFHALGWFALIILILIGYAYSGWTVSVQTITTTSNHLFPPGVTRRSLPFSELKSIRGDFEYLPRLHYVLSAETNDGRELELARDPIFPSEELLSLGRVAAKRSGVTLNLR